MLLTENLSAANQMLDAFLKEEIGSGTLKRVLLMNPSDSSSIQLLKERGRFWKVNWGKKCRMKRLRMLA